MRETRRGTRVGTVEKEGRKESVDTVDGGQRTG